REDARIEVWKLRSVGQSRKLMHKEDRLRWCHAFPDRVGWVDEPGIPCVHPAVTVPVVEHMRHLSTEITRRIPVELRCRRSQQRGRGRNVRGPTADDGLEHDVHL